MTTNLQLVEQPPKPERCPAEDLTPGQFLAPGALVTGRPTEVLFVDTYPVDGGRETLVVHRPVGVPYSVDSRVGGNHWFDLAAEEQLAEFRAGVERTQQIANIRSLADWLDDNPSVPLPWNFGVQVSPGLDTLGALDVWNSGAEGVAEVRRLAQIMGAEIVQSDERTEATKTFGRAEYKAIAWHKDGRPAEPVRCVASLHIPTEGLTCSRCGAEGMTYDDGSRDQLGLNYTRADDEPDDPTPVSPARVPMHNGGMTEGGLVDETPAEPVKWHFSFGHGQSDPDTGKNLLDHYVTVLAPTPTACRQAMLASRYGQAWAFDYDPASPQWLEWGPQWTEHEVINAMPDETGADPRRCWHNDLDDGLTCDGTGPNCGPA